jgi:hypothetical protein
MSWVSNLKGRGDSGLLTLFFFQISSNMFLRVLEPISRIAVFTIVRVTFMPLHNRVPVKIKSSRPATSCQSANPQPHSLTQD